MKIRVAGVEYGGFLDASVTQSLDALSNTFSISATAKRGIPLPFRGGEACEITVDGEVALTGYIELVSVDGNPNDHTIRLEGRDKTGDLLDSTIGSMSPLQGSSVSLRRLCEKVIKHIGSDIVVVDDAHPVPFNPAEDKMDPEPGTPAFEFLEPYARKRQVLLTSNGSGNLVIAGNSGVEVDAFVQHQVGDPNFANNVLNYSASYDTTGRFHAYTHISQLNLGALADIGEPTPSTIADQGSAQKILDNRIRAGRQLVLVSEAMSSSKSTLSRAEWEKLIRRARGSVYSATVHGFRNQAGLLWAINTIPSVRSDFAGIDCKMLINTVTFTLDGQGRNTTLGFVERDAYKLAAQEPTEEELGDGLYE